MEKETKTAFGTSQPSGASAVEWPERFATGFSAAQKLAQMSFDYWTALARYQNDFQIPFGKSVAYFQRAESEKILRIHPVQTLLDYMALLDLNTRIAHHAARSSAETLHDYYLSEIKELLPGEKGPDDIIEYISRQADTVKAVAHDYPRAIQDIAGEYGFHFEREGSVKIAETERFLLYQILPDEKSVEVRNNGKPILIVHPYVLGADILAFLPGEKKSYVHCFANQGIPTYVRILKDIDAHPAVQKITLEDDILDTKYFCEILYKNHGRLLTLNGYCQGGLITLSALLSGELDDLVDAHITCVAPIDGSRSPGLGQFLRDLPQRFNDLAYGTKILPGGNRIADGDLMSWVYKLKSIREEYPLVAMYRDLAMFRHLKKKGAGSGKTAAALNYWIFHQRHDLPMEITRLSFASYNTPITEDGVLPFKAFGRPLRISRLAEKEIKMLICYGENDTLVEKPCALAPLDYIQAEVTPFPKGHVAIATSWSLPTSEYALHTRFGDKGYRGPVRFQLDIEKEKDNAVHSEN